MDESREPPKGYSLPEDDRLSGGLPLPPFPAFLPRRAGVAFERGVDSSHWKVRVWCAKFGPDLTEPLRHRRPRWGRSWHLDEMRVVLSGVTQ